MRFRLLAFIGAVIAVTSAIVTLTLAWLGFAFWALVVGNVAGAVAGSTLILKSQPCRLAWPKMSLVREPLRFGWHVVVSMLALNSYQRLDNVTAGRVLGQTALGFYGTAWQLANVPIEKITSLLTTVLTAHLATIQDDHAALRRYLRTMTETLAIAAFPATVGLGLVAPEMVPIVFGPKWLGMVAPLSILSFYATFRSIVALLPKFLTAVGNVRYIMWNDLAALVILPTSFYLGSYRGIAGIAWGWVIAYPLVALPLYRVTFRAIGMKSSEYIKALWPAVEATLVMVFAVELARYWLPPVRSILFRLVVEVVIGAFAYLGTLRLLHKQRIDAFLRVAKNLRAEKFRANRLPSA
jgi:PST family polysaccharide transporter